MAIFKDTKCVSVILSSHIAMKGMDSYNNKYCRNTYQHNAIQHSETSSKMFIQFNQHLI